MLLRRFPAGIDVGIDVTEEIVAEARRNGPYGRVEIASGTALPYADASFQHSGQQLRDRTHP